MSWLTCKVRAHHPYHAILRMLRHDDHKFYGKFVYLKTTVLDNEFPKDKFSIENVFTGQSFRKL